MRVDDSAGAEQALKERFARHFEREDADGFSVIDGGVLGDVHGERGFAHGRARGKNDEIGLLKAAGHFVEIGVMGFEAGDALAALEKRVDGAEGVADDILNALEAFADTLLGEGEDGGFGVVEDLVGGLGLLAGLGDGVIGNADEAAQDRLVADDVNVMLDGGPVGDAIEEAGNVANVADGLQVFFLVEFFDQGDDVDGARRLGELHHARVDAAMGVEREIFGAQMFGGIVVGVIVEQDGAEDRALGFDVCRHASDGGVDGGHGGYSALRLIQ